MNLFDKYNKLYENIKQDLLSVMRDKQEWKMIKDESRSTGLTVYRREFGNSTADMFIGHVLIPNITTREFIEKSWSETGVCSVQPQLIQPDNEFNKMYYPFQHHTNDMILLQSKFNSGNRFIANREILLFRKLEQLSDKEYIVAGASVDDKDFPDIPISDDQNTIRATTLRFGYYFKEEPEGLDITFICQSKLNGYVPDWIANRVNSFTSNTLLQYKRFFMKELQEAKE